MAAVFPQTASALENLEAALASAAMPARAARSCAGLIEKLRRPVRVGIFGTADSGKETLLRALLGADPLPLSGDWPTLEIGRAAAACVTATLSDGSTLTQEGPPTADLMGKVPVFLRIGLPSDALNAMSFLYLAAGDDPREQRAALTWAARRTDIAIWCTRAYPQAEAQIWAAAPEGLKHHAYLVATGPDAAALAGAGRAAQDFHAAFACPGPDPEAGAGALRRHLYADIDEARMADVDAAQLFLHHFGHLAAPGTAAAEPPQEDAAAAATEAPGSGLDGDTVALMSEPLLYLKRRARALAEVVEWHDPASDDWAAEVLNHCTETAEGLRDRAANWPEDRTTVQALRRSLEEACDLAVLLQIEGGAAQAQDAAVMLLQLRGEIEHELAA